MKFPVSRIVPKNVKGGTLWDFLNIHSVAKYQKLMGGTIKKFRKEVSQSGMAFYLMLEALDALKMKY